MKLHKKSTMSVLVLGALIGATAFARQATVERKGTVSVILMNPEGDADGLLLQNGTQIKTPPHLSDKLRALISKNDAVTVQGVEERGKVIRAESILNDKSGKKLVDTPPDRVDDENSPLPPPPPPHAGGPRPPGLPPGPGPRQEGLSELTVKGKVTHQLFGPRGEVNGVILSNGSIVRVGPRAMEESKISLEIGKQIEARGFGTKNEFGQSIEATELKNI